MSQVPPQKFDAEYVAHLRELLNIAVEQIGPEHRTPATKAKMAEALVRNAADGITDAHHLMDVTVRAGEDGTA
ncbi:conserved hypothetical protein [Nitrobacter hamburgensis X14]|jgi:hypothetical protein|uniref:Uncharacterized protein n=1 Tax=Nitrobacter hamburgensis (strain DSM 10229 / NCIMB 13809 / X14) TaxID=323097 RepID=Q1QP75_NITHX|nr:hypothetical protein [Nitrobacter hamburgensis]ABE61972.1 conserved hypothetical protein [Nitrobacter hamburgensis X14]